MVGLDSWGTCLKNVATQVDDGVACIVLQAWKKPSVSHTGESRRALLRYESTGM
jgi:hypothetical protein